MGHYYSESKGHWERTSTGWIAVIDSEVCHDYSGPVAECKGEGTSKKQLERSNKLQDDAVAQQKQLMESIKAGLGQYLVGSGQGFDPKQLALMRTNFLNSTAKDFGSANTNLNSMLRSRGMTGGPGGGDTARAAAGLMSAQASTAAGGLRDIDLANLQQMLTNRFNTANIYAGNAATLNSNIGTFGSQASNALNQYVQASNSGFGATLSRGLGAGLAKGITGGLGAMVGGGSEGGGFTGGFYKGVTS